MVPEHGVDMVVAEAGMRYRGSARFDDELEIAATLTRLGQHLDHHDLHDRARGDGALLTEGELRHVFVDPDDFGKRRCPSAYARAWRASRRRPPMVHLRIVVPAELAEKVLELLCAAAAVINVVHLPGAAHKPEGDVILCDVAREDASVIIGDLKELEIPAVGLDRGRADRQLDLRRGARRRAGRARAAVGRGGLGGGGGAHLGADRAVASASSPSWSPRCRSPLSGSCSTSRS